MDCGPRSILDDCERSGEGSGIKPAWRASKMVGEAAFILVDFGIKKKELNVTLFNLIFSLFISQSAFSPHAFRTASDKEGR